MKHVIVVNWKETGLTETYSSLAVFTDRNPGFKQNTINNYISRKKAPYETPALKLIKCELLGPVK